MDVLNAMQVFVSVVETGSFTNAAQSLQMHRPAVSKSIQLLEQRLDGRLLNRSTRRLSMTAEGEAFYHRCKAILDNVGQAMASLGDRPARLVGKLRVDLPVSVGHLLIIPSLMEFQQRYPGIELTLGTSDKPIDLISEGVDCVVRLGALEDSSLIASGIGYLPMVTCASPGYLARHGVPERIDDLSEHLAVNYFSGSNPRTLEWLFAQGDEIQTVRVRSAINVNDTQGFVASALAGFGLIQGPALNVQAHLDSGALVQVMQHCPAPSKRVLILYPHRELMPPAVEVFVALQKDEVVLIRAASSSVGLAAIQIANSLGAVPVALTRTSEKRQALLDAGAVHVIATAEEDLVAAVARITGGKGARMAFDPVGGPEVGNILRSLSFLGIFFQYGALETADISVPVMELLGKDLTIRGYQLFEITQDEARLDKAKAFITNGLENGSLRPIVGKVFKFEEIVEAHRYMESNSQVGKIVVEL